MTFKTCKPFIYSIILYSFLLYHANKIYIFIILYIDTGPNEFQQQICEEIEVMRKKATSIQHSLIKSSG